MSRTSSRRPAGWSRRGAPAGLYHCVNSGVTNWLELAEELARLTGRAATARFEPVAFASVPLKAKRPQYCALSNAKLRAAGVEMPEWRDALRRYLRGAAAPERDRQAKLDGGLAAARWRAAPARPMPTRSSVPGSGTGAARNPNITSL